MVEKKSSSRRSAKKTVTAEESNPDAAMSLVPSGISGLDSVLGGGLPQGRSMLVVGSAGSGKTLLGMEFLCRGASEFGENGVALSFEESVQELSSNSAAFGWGIEELISDRKLVVHSIDPSFGAPVEGGSYDLSPLFMALEQSIESVGAKRILVDGINNLLSSFGNENIVRNELIRLFKWLKAKGLTILLTGERGTKTWSRLGFEEYLADGLIVLENRVDNGIGKRVLQVVKCRGVRHVSGEQPFIIGPQGISLFPLSGMEKNYEVSRDVVSLGVEGLDKLFNINGVFRGSVTLLNGSAGTGKTSLGASFIQAACERGERALLLNYEESENTLKRNLSSIGLPLQKWVDSGQLLFQNSVHLRSGLEEHLTTIQDLVVRHKPSVVVVDPISGLNLLGTEIEVRSMLLRLTDFLRFHGVTTLLTLLSPGQAIGSQHAMSVSSMADTWIIVDNVEQNGELNRTIRVVKSRGTGHSNQIQELILSHDGLSTRTAYISLDGVVIGSARLAQEGKDRLKWFEREASLKSRERKMEERGKALEAQIEALRSEYAAERDELQADMESFGRLKLEAQSTLGNISAIRNENGKENPAT